MLELFDGHLEPLTFKIGFIHADVELVATAARSFLDSFGAQPRLYEVGGPLSDRLRMLEPLVGGSKPRMLFTEVEAPGWTALFDGHAYGQGMGQFVDLMVERSGADRGHYFSYTRPGGKNGRHLGGRQWWMFRGSDTVRTVDLIENNPGRWYFATRGEVQPFEDVSAYEKRRRTERFTEQMLVDYAAAVGLRPWDESFYKERSSLMTNGQTPVVSFSLAEARAELGLSG